MKVFNKIFMFLYILMMLLFSAGAVVALWFPEIGQQAVDYFNLARETVSIRLIASGVGLIVFGISFEIICYALTPDKPKSICVLDGEQGSVRVTVTTVNQMALNTVKACQGVKDAVVKTKNGKKGLRFHILLTIDQGVAIAEVSERVRTSLKQDIEAIIGMNVAEMAVFIDNQRKNKSK